MASPPVSFIRKAKLQAQTDPTGFVLNVGFTVLVFSGIFLVCAIAGAVLAKHC